MWIKKNNRKCSELTHIQGTFVQASLHCNLVPKNDNPVLGSHLALHRVRVSTAPSIHNTTIIIHTLISVCIPCHVVSVIWQFLQILIYENFVISSQKHNVALLDTLSEIYSLKYDSIYMTQVEQLFFKRSWLNDKNSSQCPYHQVLNICTSVQKI